MKLFTLPEKMGLLLISTLTLAATNPRYALFTLASSAVLGTVLLVAHRCSRN